MKAKTHLSWLVTSISVQRL